VESLHLNLQNALWQHQLHTFLLCFCLLHESVFETGVAPCENDSVPESISFGNHLEAINTESHIGINAKPLFRGEVDIIRRQLMAFMSH